MKLLLITLHFPYFPGEYFLENEVKVLSKKFEEILIVPSKISSDMERMPSRGLPDNVKTFLLPERWSRWKSLRRILSSSCCLEGFLSFFKTAIHGRVTSISELRNLLVHHLLQHHYISFLKQYVPIDNYDVYYSYWGNYLGNFLNIIMAGLDDPRRHLFVSRFHRYDLYAEEQDNKKRLYFQNELLKCCDIAAPCSLNGESYLINHYPQYGYKIRHEYLGVNIQKDINPGSSDGVLRILTCSNVVKVKRLTLLIASLKNIERKTIWSHIGVGPDLDIFLSLTQKLPQNVNFKYCGQLSNEDVLNYYRLNPIDVFVNVSSSEGVPVSIMEALSFGIEIIATDVGGVSELVRPEFGTLLHVDFCPNDLTLLFEKFQPNIERRINAQQFQQKHFSLNNYQQFGEKMRSALRAKRWI